MRKVRKLKAKPTPKTRADSRPVRSVMVENPYGLGHDRAQRVVDTVTAMHARRQIDDRQLRAAEIYRTAYDTAASAGGGMHGERSGGGATRTTLSEAKIQAGETLNEADRLLGLMDGRVVRLVVGEGHSIAEAAGSSSTAIQQKHVGMRLRDALDVLADRWVPVAKASGKGRTLVSRVPDAKPTVSAGEPIERARVGFVTARAAGYYGEE